MENTELLGNDGVQTEIVLLRPKEVADKLGISPRTVHKLVRDRKLDCVQVNERDRRFTIEQVKEYIARMTITAPNRLDRKISEKLRWSQPKGGERSVKVSRTSLLEEMSRWQ